VISSFIWQLPDKTQAISVTKYTNQIEMSDVILVIERAVSAHDQSDWMTTTMSDPCVYPTT
jgi:hypothetical protein